MLTHEGWTGINKGLGGAYKTIRDVMPRPPKQKEGQCDFKPTLLSTVWCKCLSSVLRAQTYVGDPGGVPL